MDIYGVEFMYIKYFITAFITFSSISLAQGASFLASQKLGEKISSVIPLRDLSFSKQLGDTLSQILRAEFLDFNNDQQKAAVQLVSASPAIKGKKRKPKTKKERPKLSVRNPFSI